MLLTQPKLGINKSKSIYRGQFETTIMIYINRVSFCLFDVYSEKSRQHLQHKRGFVSLASRDQLGIESSVLHLKGYTVIVL